MVCGSCLWALTPAGQTAVSHLLARYQLRCLLAAKNDDAAQCAAGLAAHGPLAFGYLAEALTSPRFVVAQATQLALQKEIATWDQLPPGEGNRRLRLLSAVLAAHANRLAPAAREFAMRQAARLLSSDSALSDQSLRDCESILGSPGALQAERSRQRLGLVSGAEIANDRRGTRPPWSVGVDDGSQVPRLPGGALPVAEPSLSTLEAGEVSGNESGAELKQPVESSGADSSAMAPLRIAMDEHGVVSQAAAVVPILQVVTQASATIIETPSQVRRAHMLASDLPGDAEDATTLASMFDLHSDDPQAVVRAEAELSQRGFRARELELARRLTDEDAQVRSQLAEMLPGISGIDTKLWLTWLSRDRSADVRLAALTVMATTGHPQMLKHVASVAAHDDDARIQKLGERLSSPAANRGTR